MKNSFPNINHLTFDESSAYEGDLNHSQRGDNNNNATKILNYWETEYEFSALHTPFQPWNCGQLS